MINCSTWLAQSFELISQMNDMSQAHQENHTSSQSPSSVAAAAPVSEQVDRKERRGHVLCLTEQVVTWQPTVNLLKVKTWTWHSHLTQLAQLDVSKVSSNAHCLSNGKAKNKEHLLLYLLQFSSAVLGWVARKWKLTRRVIVKKPSEPTQSKGGLSRAWVS